MNTKNIKELPLKYKERIEKSCLILQCLDHVENDISINDYRIILVIDSDNFNRFHIKDIYTNNDNSYLEYCSYDMKYIHIAEAVIDCNGHILKNRWGIDEYKNWYNSLIMDTMTYEEIKKYFNTKLGNDELV